MIKKMFVLMMLSVLFIVFVEATKDIERMNQKVSKDYFIQHTLEEVGSNNFVTGIYLDYRLLDSIFEAGILLVTVTGIIFMSKKDEEMY
ncbi:hypothetical protein [Anaerosolibacter sp.]|uniref:hypothetical protein n=1 Tax=Anaerosolibacter sp. TaxID=1872527 RepID=UPI0039EE6316